MKTKTFIVAMLLASSAFAQSVIINSPGTVETAELGDINPNARAEVAVNPHSNVIPVTRVNGITSVVTEPEGGIISGSSAMLNLAGWTPQEMTLKAPLAMHIHFPRLRTNAFDEVPQDEEAAKE